MDWLMQLPTWLQALFATCFTYAMTAFGAAFVFVSGRIRPSVLILLQGSAAGIMIAASFYSLLLPAAERLNGVGAFSAVVLGGGFAAGGVFIILAEVVLRRSQRFAEEKKRSGALTFFAMTLHNIPEGFSVGVAFGSLAAGDAAGWVSAVVLAFGIGVQNFPEGLCVAVPMRRQGFSVGKAFFCGQLSGVVEIAAGVLGAVAVGVITALLPWALSFSAGAMIAVSCAELLPGCFAEGKQLAAGGIVFGFVLMMVLDVCAGYLL